MYEIEVRHQGLGKYRYIKGKDRYVVEQKARAQEVQWNDMWHRRQLVEQKRKQAWDKESKKKLAQERTKDAQAELKELDNVLLHTLGVNDAIDWDSLKDKTSFSEAKPEIPQLKTILNPPVRVHTSYPLTLWDKIFKKQAEKKIVAYEKAEQKKFEQQYDAWERITAESESDNEVIKEAQEHAVAGWQKRFDAFKESRAAANAAIDEQKAAYKSKSVLAIVDYCDLVLSRSQYPDYFPQQFDLDYIEENKTLIIEYVLPHISAIPPLKEVGYIQSKDEFTEKMLSESQLNKIYDKLLYDIALRTIHEVLEADVIDTIDAVAFNGWVHFISPATGKDVNSCILSLHTKKAEFLEINLGKVDSKTCFKALKGVGSSKLHSLTPIAPILHMNKTDSRFIASYEVEKGLDESTNLATMDWQDFEHLVREVFETEFSMAGGEVRVTQSSRDGGVDAVIFDPDPIRGGKIVVQAKRYNNTVGVSAVRDLYGTVMNEGANKGILITTSDYGPDAYAFARDKPITLLNGGNLLHLLEKHGRRARINLHEAKKYSA